MELYHYCSFSTFKEIISSKQLWLTQLVRTNDKEEIIRTLSILWNKVREKLIIQGMGNACLCRNIELLDEQLKIDKVMSTKGSDIPYAVCFSTEKDVASLWEEYADNGKGVCLCFSSEFIKDIKNIMPHPNAEFYEAIGFDKVIYDCDLISEQFSNLFKDLLNNSEGCIEWLTVRKTLKCYSAFIKNPSFRNEGEIRIVYYPDKEHKTEKGLTQCLTDTIPHCSLPWIQDEIVGLKKIIIGYDCDYGKEDIQKELAEAKLENIEITKSECSYRISENKYIST